MRRGSGQYTKGRTRYQPLVDHLAEIEALLGVPLSDTARISGDIWVAPRFIYVQAWRKMGWRAQLDRRDRCVIFTRYEIPEPAE